MSQNILLTDALKAEGIPLPQEIVTCEKFTRWGKHERFWAKAVGDGFIFGDFSKALSRTVFPKTRGKLSSSFIAIRRKSLEEQKNGGTERTEKILGILFCQSAKYLGKSFGCSNTPVSDKEKNIR